MKITGFHVLIDSSNYDDNVKLFEDLGFERRHNPVTEVEVGEVNTCIMKDPNGFYVDIANTLTKEKDSVLIRMNVDDFDEAYNLLKEHGFKNTRGDGSVDTGSAKAATMVGPSGLIIALVKHIK